MNIAVEGCLHGQLEQVYKQLNDLQKKLSIKIDLLLICGDFQALRDQTDLSYMHCPEKYKSMGSFYKYFQQIKTPPILTIFIGGNHQAVNYMRGLYFGGWAAKNIYYLGQAGSIIVKKGNTQLRINGMSGIYNHRDFQYTLKMERIPFYGSAKISSYHIKQIQTYRMELFSRIQQMKQIQPEVYSTNSSSSIDIFLSHDWPKSIKFLSILDIALYGQTKQLYKFKPFFEKQINSGVLGSPPGQRIMKLMKPSYWFSAHMHIKYPAIYPHNQNQYTHFLALDKCLQKRSCLQVIHLTTPDTKSQQQISSSKQIPKIMADLQWLTVLNLTMNLQNKGQVLYSYGQQDKELKLCNSKQMNELIMQFPKIYKEFTEKITQMNSLYYELQQKHIGDELKQTQELLDLIGIKDKRMFVGTIFPKGYFMAEEVQEDKQQIQQDKNNNDNKEKIVVENVDDEIELDL